MNKNPAVEAWLRNYDNPQKPLVIAVREIILAADPRVSEAVKWQAPTFIYKGNIASFFPKSKRHASLMFHKGATIPGAFEHLLGDGKEARSMKFLDADDLDVKAQELQAIIRAWCAQQDA